MLKKLCLASVLCSSLMALAHADQVRVVPHTLREMPWKIEDKYTWYVFPLPSDYTFTLKVNEYLSKGDHVRPDPVTLVCGKQTFVLTGGSSAVCNLKGVDDAYYHVYAAQFHNGAEGVMIRDDE